MDSASFLERGYIHFSKGTRYTVKLGNAPEQNEILSLTLNGEDIKKVLDKKYKIAVATYLAIGRGSWNGDTKGQGLPESIKGYDLKKLCQERQVDTGLVCRNELIEYMKETGTIDKQSGLQKDERVIVK